MTIIDTNIDPNYQADYDSAPASLPCTCGYKLDRLDDDGTNDTDYIDYACGSCGNFKTAFLPAIARGTLDADPFNIYCLG